MIIIGLSVSITVLTLELEDIGLSVCDDNGSVIGSNSLSKTKRSVFVPFTTPLDQPKVELFLDVSGASTQSLKVEGIGPIAAYVAFTASATVRVALSLVRGDRPLLLIRDITVPFENAGKNVLIFIEECGLPQSQTLSTAEIVAGISQITDNTSALQPRSPRGLYLMDLKPTNLLPRAQLPSQPFIGALSIEVEVAKFLSSSDNGGLRFKATFFLAKPNISGDPFFCCLLHCASL